MKLPHSPQISLESIALLLGLAVIALVIWLVLSSRQKAARRRQLLVELGFVPLASPEPELVRKFAPLFEAYDPNKANLNNMARKPVPKGELYIFDLADRSGSDTSHLKGIVGAACEELNMPYFSLIWWPKPAKSRDGLMHKTSLRLFEWVLSRAGWTQVHFPEYPDLDQELLVVGDNEIAVRRYLEGERLTRLLDMTDVPYQLTGWEDAFIVQLNPRYPDQVQGEDLSWRVHSAEKIIDILI